MREILFRGLRTDGKGWAIGDYNCFNTIHSIRFRDDVDPCEVRVKPETVGQFTGLFDKNGVRVFEGDLVEISTLNKVVGYSDAHATFTLNCIESGNINVYNITSQSISVIGNIHTT